jgi:hypothetical protein
VPAARRGPSTRSRRSVSTRRGSCARRVFDDDRFPDALDRRAVGASLRARPARGADQRLRRRLVPPPVRHALGLQRDRAHGPRGHRRLRCRREPLLRSAPGSAHATPSAEPPPPAPPFLDPDFRPTEERTSRSARPSRQRGTRASRSAPAKRTQRHARHDAGFVPSSDQRWTSLVAASARTRARSRAASTRCRARRRRGCDGRRGAPMLTLGGPATCRRFPTDAWSAIAKVGGAVELRLEHDPQASGPDGHPLGLGHPAFRRTRPGHAVGRRSAIPRLGLDPVACRGR